VLTVKPDEIVAHFKITVLILQGQTTQVTGLPIDLATYQTDKTITDPEIVQLLSVNNFILTISNQWTKSHRNNKKRERLKKKQKLNKREFCENC
jgi:predicted proteasome-type protease